MRGKFDLITHLAREGCDPNEIAVKLALRKALLGCKTVLDVGSGVARTMRQLGVEYAVGAEGYLPSLEIARRQNTHDEYVQCDVRKLGEHFQTEQFDACIALDLIEHLNKKDGLKLIADMERIARRRVVFLTPSGFLPQGNTEAGDLQAHHSGWEPEEMKRLGYRVYGQLGPKKLRGEYHRLKYRPNVFSGMVSFAGQMLWSKRHPQSAAAILCVKKLDAGK
jgi:ubiquinone/menaquinone biosynthesis C-methylase UbiE